MPFKALIGFALLVVLPSGIPPPAAARESSEVRTCEARLLEDPGSPGPRIELALAWRRQGTIEGRRAAERIYLEALRRWPGNVDLLLAYGQLRVEQGFTSHAEDVFRRVILADPDRLDAHFGLARLGIKDYRRFLDRRMLERSLHSISRVLALDPDHREALFLRAFALDAAGDSAAARSAVNRLVAGHPRDPWGYLMLEMMAVERGRLSEAGWALEKGLSLLRDPAETDAFEALAQVDIRAEESRLSLAGRDRDLFLADFWKRLDPTPPTELNERRLEHVRRVVLADLLYGIREKRIRGWSTAPGEAIIRFGPPLARRYGVGELQRNGIAPPQMTHVHAWAGEAREFHFVDRNLSGFWVQPHNSGRPTAMDVAMSREENHYEIPHRGETLDYMLEVARFRGKNGHTLVELAVAARDPGVGGREIQRDMALYDREWNYLSYDVDHLDQAVRISDRSRPGENLLVDLVRFQVPDGPDSVWLGSQILDRVSQGFGARLEKVGLMPFPDSILCMSDVLLMDRVGFERRGGKFSRPGGWGLPNPSRRFWPGENVPVYFEAYNLEPGPDGLVHYAVQIQVDDAVPAHPRLTRPALIDLKAPRGPRVRARFEERGDGRDLRRLLDLSVGRLPPGWYRLSLTVEDLTSGRACLKSARFRIVAPPDLSGGF